ncbi:hypothetical protein [Flagellimonas sp.]|uniref:hypothetical protein n=1 Tax=Flagellimonas sp. TaxID=2058762 RepID=UPI003BA9A264
MKVNIKIPTHWNELSFQQLDNIAHQFHCYNEIIKENAGQLDRTTQRLFYQVAKELLRHNGWIATRKVLREVHPKEYVPFTKFIYEGVDRTKFRPMVKVKGLVYHAPDTRLRNITIGEFSFADAAFYQWTNTNNPIWLDVLCASLYREKSETHSDIDIRKTFIKQAVDSRADSFGKLSLKKKLGIAKTYEGCRNHISSAFPRIFPKPIKIEGQEPPIPKKYISFGKIILNKIEGDPSKLESSNNTNMYDFLSIIDADLDRIKKMKK